MFCITPTCECHSPQVTGGIDWAEIRRQANNILERLDEQAHSDNVADIVDLVKYALTHDRAWLVESLEGMKYTYSDKSNMYYERATGALRTNAHDEANAWNNTLDKVIALLKDKGVK